MIRLGLVLSAIIAAPVTFFFLIWHHWLFALPFLGCGIMAWYLGKSIQFIANNAISFTVISNILVNMGFAFSQRGGDEFMRKLSVDPEIFKKNFQQRNAR